MANTIDETELKEVVRRAQEIAKQPDARLEPHPEAQECIRAAEEVGVPREATLQALQERLGFPVEPYKVGEFVFALSTDGHHYVAELLSQEGRRARVKFLSGSEHSCDLSDLRPYSLSPGQRLSYFSPRHEINVHGKLEEFDGYRLRVKVHSMGISEELSLGKIRLPIERKWISRIPLWAVALASALGGGAIGTLITYLVTR